MAKLTSLLRQHSVGLLALFVALGGTSYAATQLPKDSVGSTQIKSGAVSVTKIKKGAVDSAAVRNRSLTGSDLAYNTVGGAQLAERSVGSADLADGSVSASKLAPDAIGPAQLAPAPAIRLLRGSGSSQSVPDSSGGPASAGVTFPTTEYSQGGFATTTEPLSGATGLVIPRTGVYAVSAAVRWATNATGNRSLNFSGPQPGGVRASNTVPAVNGDLTRQLLATTERFNAGDVIFLSASQTSTAALNITGSQNQQHFSATFLSP